MDVALLVLEGLLWGILAVLVIGIPTLIIYGVMHAMGVWR